MAVVAKYLMDTSVWARRRDPAVSRRVVPLIRAGLVGTCSVLDAEALHSTRTPAEYEQVRANRWGAYELLPIEQDVWDRALDVQRTLAARSMTRAVGISDLLIAATAARHGVTVLHYDADFDIVSEVTGQPMEWVVARGAVS